MDTLTLLPGEKAEYEYRKKVGGFGVGKMKRFHHAVTVVGLFWYHFTSSQSHSFLFFKAG